MERYVRTIAEMRCPECGEILENTGGDFSLCPEGHGKLHPKISFRECDLICKFMMGRPPVANRITKPKRPVRYIINGEIFCLFRAVGKSTAAIYSNEHDSSNFIVARCKGLKLRYGIFQRKPTVHLV